MKFSFRSTPSAFNPIDYMIPKGTFKPILRFHLQATLGSDLAVSWSRWESRVTRFKRGDAVFASIFDLDTGALAEFAVVPEKRRRSRWSDSRRGKRSRSVRT
jgi:NADPH:quinone reductase-like Zn-dependent oxidoreductase